MPWTMETKMGFGWATVVVVIFIAAVAAAKVAENPAPLVLPVLAYLGFLAWVNRVR